MLIYGGSLAEDIDREKYDALRKLRRGRPLDGIIRVLAEDQNLTPQTSDTDLRALEKISEALRYSAPVWIWQLYSSAWPQDGRISQATGVTVARRALPEEVAGQLDRLLPQLRERGLSQVAENRDYDFLLRLAQQLEQGGSELWASRMAPWLYGSQQRIPLRGLMFSLAGNPEYAANETAIAHNHALMLPASWQGITADCTRVSGHRVGLACAMHEAFTMNVARMWLRMPGCVDRTEFKGYFTALGFSDDDSLWPKGGSSFSGYQLLLEYFTFREKFMFTGLRGLEHIDFPAELPWFEIEVVLAQRWEHDFSFTEKHLRLNCVPVINLFPLESDPLTLDSLQTEYMLRPMRVQDGHIEIYSVDSVMSSSLHTYVPFSSFRHKGGMMRHEAPEYYYHTRVRRGPSGLHNTWLILGGEAFDNHTVPEDESLSLTLTGTNGQLPRRALQSTVLDTVMKTTSASITVRNLCAPTLPCYPPARDRFHWRVLSHLGSGFISMLDNAEVLRGTLALYEWTDSEMNRRRLEAIIDVKHGETERFEQGYLVRGVQIEVTLNSHGFAGRGDICLFGEMLSRFFALYTDIYLFNRLTIILQPTGERLEWEEKHNRRIPG
ncbi:hypothetical protein TUM12370_16410 [Salmonella enterica subsp. enterica serovar Choleraesuis]|nr:hypothetical protein TUM12370_16410 [Salmonella enterica subsp. enterica serovar Choleraesuis]